MNHKEGVFQEPQKMLRAPVMLYADTIMEMI